VFLPGFGAKRSIWFLNRAVQLLPRFSVLYGTYWHRLLKFDPALELAVLQLIEF
jgi:hypothetical protein